MKIRTSEALRRAKLVCEGQPSQGIGLTPEANNFIWEEDLERYFGHPILQVVIARPPLEQ
jgi:hypothetical protein